MHEYLFDVKLFASFKVRAASQDEAVRLLDDALLRALLSVATGDRILTAEVSSDGEFDLIEVDGEEA